MNLHKTHPEAHDAWLYAMGIDVRWRHRSTHGESLAVQASALPDLFVLPQVLAQARCWVIGASPLSNSERFMLAAMLWSVRLSPQEVVYLTISATDDVLDRESISTPVPYLPSWPTLRESRVTLDALRQAVEAAQSLPKIPSIWFIGEADEGLKPLNGALVLPMLSQLLHAPERKASVWQQLKVLRFGS